MASTYISLVGNETRLASQMRAFIDRLQDVREDAARLKAIADQAAAGADWEGLRLAFGFQTTADAEACYNLLGSVNTALSTDAFIAQMLSRIG